MRLELGTLDYLNPDSGQGGFDEELEFFVDDRAAAGSDYPETALEKKDFYGSVAEFLWTEGKRYSDLLRFQSKLECEAVAPDIRLMSVPYQHNS